MFKNPSPIHLAAVAAGALIAAYWWEQRQLKDGNTVADNLLNWGLSMGSKMKTSAAGIAAITQREGERLIAYNDTGGKPTIGVGHLITAFESFPNGITRAQSQALLAQDLVSAENAINARVKVPLTQARFDALVSLVFNIGSANWRASSIPAKINAGNWEAAKATMAQFNKVRNANGVLVYDQGLQNRRDSEISQFA